MKKPKHIMFLAITLTLATGLAHSCKRATNQDSETNYAQRYQAPDQVIREEKITTFLGIEISRNERIVRDGRKSFYWTYHLMSDEVKDNFKNEINTPGDYSFLCFYKSWDMEKASRETQADLKKYFLASQRINEQAIRITAWNWYLGEKSITDRIALYKSEEGVNDHDGLRELDAKRTYYQIAKTDSFSSPFTVDPYSPTINHGSIFHHLIQVQDEFDQEYLRKKFPALSRANLTVECPKPDILLQKLDKK